MTGPSTTPFGPDPADRFATSAGPYVLGALSPAERSEFEAHLRTCPDCRRGVEQLAGLPGLLSRTPPQVVATLTEDDPAAALREGTGVPDTVLPGLLRTVRRRRTTRRAVLGAGLVAAAALVAAVATDGLRTDPGPGTTATLAAPAPTQSRTGGGTGDGGGQPRVMDPLVPTPITATVALTEVGWGTKVDLVCAYAHAQTEQAYRYALVVTDRTGAHEQIGTWTAVPGKDAQLTGATSWTRDQIASVQVQTTGGTTVLQLDET
ncbi:anti-sigma factor family protein [Kineococcus sp. SYSU DK001]|uniref:anti-sigma factor family protein n=1 Tax=Kineococcus sp. SYSU DK001 TaxID=3383122 RepID=UPI003D7D94CE